MNDKLRFIVLTLLMVGLLPMTLFGVFVTWHIGGAHELTFKKFCHIFWNWVTLKKRAN